MFPQCVVAGDTGYTKANYCEGVRNLLKCKEKKTLHINALEYFIPSTSSQASKKYWGSMVGIRLPFFSLILFSRSWFFLPVLVSESPCSLGIPETSCLMTEIGFIISIKLWKVTVPPLHTLRIIPIRINYSGKIITGGHGSTRIN